jgi:LPXTG-motif cell wall-anchored protein
MADDGPRMMGGDLGTMAAGNMSCCTGGMMTMMYTLWGLVMVGFVALVMLLIRRK